MARPYTIHVEMVTDIPTAAYGVRSQSKFVAPLKLSATAIVVPGTAVKRGMPFTYQDARARITGTVTRRYKLRNGTIKLWLGDLTQVAVSNSLHR